MAPASQLWPSVPDYCEHGGVSVHGSSGSSHTHHDSGGLDGPLSLAPSPQRQAAGRQVCRAKAAHLCEGGDEAGDADQASVGKQLGHLGDPADVLLPVSGRESQVFVKAVADVVPIQGVAGDGVGHQVLLQSKTDRCFPSTGETCWERAR